MSKKPKSKPKPKPVKAVEPPVRASAFADSFLPPAAPVVMKMVGSMATPYTDPTRYGYLGIEGPNLPDYEKAARHEPVIKTGLKFYELAMLASLGPYMHENPEIQAFVRANFHRMKGNHTKSLGDLIHSGLLFGKGVSEMLMMTWNGKWWLDGIVNYHPRSIRLVTNRRGVLSDNKPDVAPGSMFKRTGIWQEVPYEVAKSSKTGLIAPNYVRIPLSKAIVVSHDDYYGNLHGESVLSAAYLFYEMKWANLKNWLVTSEKYGAPSIVVAVPSGVTSNLVPDGQGGQRLETTAEAVSRGFAELTAAGVVVVETPPGHDTKEVVVNPVTTGNNFGDSYKLTQYVFDYQMYTAMGLPPLLFMEHSGGLGAGEISQTQADIFKLNLVAFYKQFVEPFVEQCIGRLVYWNFGVTDPGYFPFQPIDPGAAKRAMDSIEKGIKNGLLDMSAEKDLQFCRATNGWDPAEGEHLQNLLKGNRQLMRSIRNQDSGRIETARITTGTQVDIAEKTHEHEASEGALDRESKEKIAKSKPKPTIKAPPKAA